MVQFVDDKEKLVKNIKRGAIALGGGIALTIGFFLFTENISEGHAGVVYSRSHGVEDKTLGQGTHFVNPMKRIVEYPVSTVTVEYKELSLATKDGKPLTIDITYDYFNNVDRLPYIYNKFKGQAPTVIEDTWLKSRLKDSALAVTSKYTILEIFQKREEIKQEIQKQFQEDVQEHGFIVENVVVGTPVPDENTAKAIQAVVDAQQQLEALKIEKEKAQLTADKKKIEATGNAQALLIESEAKAQANAKLEKSLTPNVIQYEWVKKWNGQQPSTSVNGSSNGTGIIVGK